MSYEAGMVVCSEDGCEAQIKNNRWARTKASNWFFTRDNKAYCPDHHPDWVAGWRAKKGNATPKDGTVIFCGTCMSCEKPISKKPGETESWVHENGQIRCG